MNDIAVLPMIGGHKNWFPVSGDHAYMAMIVRTLLFVSLAFAGTVSYAQQPKPPVLFGSSSTSPVSGNIMFKETFGEMALGSPQNVAKRWAANGLTPNSNGTDLTIANSNPVASGFGKYLHAVAIKDGDNVWRTEIRYNGTPHSSPQVDLADVGSDGNGGRHYTGPVYWYGFKMALDDFTRPDGSPILEKVHFSQFHDDAGQGVGGVTNQDNPMVSLMGNGKSLQVFMENMSEPDGVDGDVSEGTNVSSPIIMTNPLGKTFDVIFQVKQDSRTRAQGGTGVVRIWIGDDPNPKWEWVNRQTGKPSSTGGNSYAWYFPMGGYLSLWRWSGVDGQRYEARFDNFVVMDDTGSYEAMSAALNAP